MSLRSIDKTEFFWHNPQMLGFSNPTRATVMVVKEILDNALDACEDIGVLPDIKLKLTANNNIFSLEALDNGSGIPNPKHNVPRVFGEILYGSKFNVYKQSRGQQGIGVSAAFLWSQKTVGEPVKVITKPHTDQHAHEFLLTTKGKGKIKVLSYKTTNNFPTDHGTYINLKFHGSWRSKHHLFHYLEATAIANPEANISAVIDTDHITYKRSVNTPPPKPQETKPHPHTADIGMIEELITKTKTRKLKNFLWDTFSSVGDNAINELSQKLSFSIDTNPKHLKKHQIRELVEALKTTKFRAPSSSCLVPLGTDRIESALLRFSPEFCHAVTRYPVVCEGHPTIVEAGVAYGGNIKGFKLFRIANRVPLVYDEGNCAITEGIKINYKNYNIKQKDDGTPDADMILLVHVCSTHIPYGTQAKTFIAHKDIIINEIKLAVQQVMRKLSTHINKKNYYKKLATDVKERFTVATLLANKVYDVLEITDEPPYEAIARMCNSLLYDDKTKTLINTTNETISIDGKTLKPNDKMKMTNKPNLVNVVVKSEIDKAFGSE